MSNQTKLTLTDEQLIHVCTVSMKNWVDGIVETFACFGVDLNDPECPPVKPSDYALPVRQWNAIAECLTGPPSLDGIARANHAMNWVNLGPSSFEEDEC